MILPMTTGIKAPELRRDGEMIRKSIVDKLEKEIQRAKNHLEALEDLLNELLEADACNKENISPEEAVVAGINPKDKAGIKELQQVLADWDYMAEQSAQAAYAKPGIERLQLLRQIKELLTEGKGFAKLFQELEPTRGEKARNLAKATGRTLQPWRGLGKSVRLREFVTEHGQFLGGHVINKKWHFHTSS